MDELLNRFWQNLTGRTDNLAEMVSDPSRRRGLLRQGWIHVSKIFMVAVLIGVVYQYLVVRWFYSGEALIVSIVLAGILYLPFRGAVNPIVRHNWQLDPETK